jgi:type VI secretion system secreted protein VgrG
MKGGNIDIHAPGTLDVKARGVNRTVRTSTTVPPIEFPDGEIEPNELLLEHLYHDGTPLAGADYTVTLANGQTITGKLDAAGQARVKLPEGAEGSATVTYGPMPGKFERKDQTPNPDAGGKARVKSLIDKYTPDGAQGE